MRRPLARFALIAVCLATVPLACSDTLAVRNTIDPTIEQVLNTPQTVEQTIASGIQSCHNSIVSNGDGFLLPQLSVLSLEGYGTVANVGIGSRVGIPRGAIANSHGSLAIHQNFTLLSQGARLAANALNALEALVQSGRTTGTAATDLRARAFAHFAIGCHQGWLAMLYDSAAIIRPRMPPDSIPPLSGANDVMAAAIAMLDSAAAIAARATDTSAFPLPTTWISGNALTRSGFIRLVRSWRARFRAGVARTPAERALVNWPAVIADVDSGVTGDFTLNVGAALGWSAGGNVNATLFYFMSPLYYGMADVSGEYDRWLALPLESRGSFLVLTPDRRWPQGATRAAQQAGSAVPAGISSRPYVAAGSDFAGHPWAVSPYFFNRFQYIRATGGTGALPVITRAEMDLLAAEGHLYGGNLAAATARIDVTRLARGQLPALSGTVTSTSDPVPGGASCVPRIPVGPSFTSTTCGNVWEAMKWEKRMETAFTGFGQWFFDGRGWGDLVQGTALEFPVPYQELAARQRPFYTLGGGGPSSAPRGTYGF